MTATFMDNWGVTDAVTAVGLDGATGGAGADMFEHLLAAGFNELSFDDFHHSIKELQPFTDIAERPAAVDRLHDDVAVLLRALKEWQLCNAATTRSLSNKGRALINEAVKGSERSNSAADLSGPSSFDEEDDEADNGDDDGDDEEAWILDTTGSRPVESASLPPNDPGVRTLPLNCAAPAFSLRTLRNPLRAPVLKTPIFLAGVDATAGRVRGRCGQG